MLSTKENDKGKRVGIVSETMKTFLHRADPLKQLHYSVFNGEVESMFGLLQKRQYTLIVANIPYEFQILGSTHDDVPLKYAQIEKMVKDFVELWKIL